MTSKFFAVLLSRIFLIVTMKQTRIIAPVRRSCEEMSVVCLRHVQLILK